MLNAMAELKKMDHEILLLNHSADILRWDQETYMPERAIEERAEQIALLQGMIHDKVVDPRQGELLAAIGMSEKTKLGPASLSDESRAFLRETYRRYMKQTRTPKRLVEELARTQSIAQAEWIKAKKESNYKLFQPHLAKLVALIKEYAACQGYQDHIYDPLLDEYEPWMTTRELERVLTELKHKLVGLLKKITSSKIKNRPDILQRTFPIDKQREFGMIVLAAMGFDFSRGRIDVSAHPFTTTLGGDDVRLTTRFNERFLPSGAFGTIHEGGHGLYELGFGESLKGSILANGTSLGIHESQSRLWENIVGRSRPFWQAFFPALKKLFPEALRDVDSEAFYRAINSVCPSLIRVEADEVTYNLHIILRFTLEKRILTDEIALDDLPEAWKQESEALLGITPRSDREGLLQDVHWSMGAFGYFPTYTLGNLAAAQLFATMEQKHPSLRQEIAAGNLGSVREWLKNNIHSPGSVHPAQDLLVRVTGSKLDHTFFMQYLEKKYGELYDF